VPLRSDAGMMGAAIAAGDGMKKAGRLSIRMKRKQFISTMIELNFAFD
jgi:hypothetical protein